MRSNKYIPFYYYILQGDIYGDGVGEFSDAGLNKVFVLRFLAGVTTASGGVDVQVDVDVDMNRLA